jgi:hypothetical protein
MRKKRKGQLKKNKMRSGRRSDIGAQRRTLRRKFSSWVISTASWD